jgi:hypothetical protein
VTASSPVIRPSRARRQHDRIVRVEGRELIDDAGNVATPWRVVPVLDAMWRRGAISLDMRIAGEEFHDRFRLAQLDGLRAASLLRAGGCGVSWGGSGNHAARKAIMEAIDALGGGRAPAASCAWHVLGLEWSLRRWAAEFRNGSTNEASGILIAALGVLASECA